MSFIGVIDSGIGGLTILKTLQKQLPYNYVYVADHAFCPYGAKSNEVVRSRAFNLAGYLVQNGAQAVVLACNTLSAYASEIQSELNVPVYDVITPTCSRICSNPQIKRVALLATKSTINNGAYHANLLSRGVEVVNFDCSGFVPYIEQRATNSIACQRVMEKALRNLPQSQADAVILGCTHFPLVRSQITYFCPRTQIIECACDVPQINTPVSQPSTTFITTGNAEFASNAAKWYGNITFKRVNI